MALTPEVVQFALPLAEKFAGAGLTLVPFEGSALAELVTAACAELTALDPTGSLVESLVTAANIAEVAEQDSNQHLNILNHYTELVAKAVQQHFLVARTIVSPVVRDYHDRVQVVLKQITPSSLLGVEIEKFRFPAFLNNPSLESEFRRYEDVPFDAPSLNYRLPNLPVEELVETLKIGAGGIDGEIEKWAAEVGHDKLRALWDEVFTQRSEGEPRSFRTLVEDIDNGVDNAMAMFLWSRKLLNNPPEETDMSLDSFNEAMERVRDQAGAKLSRVQDELAKALKSKILVRNQVGRKTVVYPDVYEQFLEGEGSNELLYGNALLDRREIMQDAILARAEELGNTWNSHVAMIQRTEANNRYARTIEALDIEFRRMLAAEEGEDITRERFIVADLFNEQLAALRPDSVDDLEDVCLKLMCRSRFYKTRAEEILCAINCNMEDNPGLQVREAAALSLIEYVADWVAKLIKVKG